MVLAPQHSRLSRLARKAMAVQRNFEWLIFLGGLLTPCVMALVVSAAPPQLPASFPPADTVRHAAPAALLLRCLGVWN